MGVFLFCLTIMRLLVIETDSFVTSYNLYYVNLRWEKERKERHDSYSPYDSPRQIELYVIQYFTRRKVVDFLQFVFAPPFESFQCVFFVLCHLFGRQCGIGLDHDLIINFPANERDF